MRFGKATSAVLMVATLPAVAITTIGGAEAVVDTAPPRTAINEIDPAGPSPEVLRRQDQMYEIFDPFYLEVTKNPALSGFLRAKVSEDITSLTLYWSGPVPALAKEFAETSAFPVTIEATKYSEKQVGDLARSISKNWNSRWGSFEGVRLTDDWKSFEINWAPLKGANTVEVTAELSKSVPEVNESIAFRETKLTKLGWRWNGASTTPWNAGAGLAISGTPYEAQCTMGPAVITGAGAERFITADHCGTHAWVDGNGTSIGSTVYSSPNHDYQFVQANASNKLFIGPWNNFDGPTRAVSYLGGNASGTYVCHEGANSGERCVLLIEDSYRTDSAGWTMWEASDPFSNDVVVAAGGDSGAFVGTKGQTQATARGLLIGSYDPDVPCGNTSMRTVAICKPSIAYYSMTQLINHHPGMTLKTNP